MQNVLWILIIDLNLGYWTMASQWLLLRFKLWAESLTQASRRLHTTTKDKHSWTGPRIVSSLTPLCRSKLSSMLNLQLLRELQQPSKLSQWLEAWAKLNLRINSKSSKDQLDLNTCLRRRWSPDLFWCLWSKELINKCPNRRFRASSKRKMETVSETW